MFYTLAVINKFNYAFYRAFLNIRTTLWVPDMPTKCLPRTRETDGNTRGNKHTYTNYFIVYT